MLKKLIESTELILRRMVVAVQLISPLTLLVAVVGFGSLVGLTAYVSQYVGQNGTPRSTTEKPGSLSFFDINKVAENYKSDNDQQVRAKDSKQPNSGSNKKSASKNSSTTEKPKPTRISRPNNPSANTNQPRTTNPSKPLPKRPSPPSYVTLLNSSFDSMTTSSPAIGSEYKLAMGDTGMYAGPSNLTYTSVVPASGHGKVLRQTIPANKYGTNYGIVTFPRLKQTVDEAYIQYDVRFSSGFDWSLGGKLPGLAGVIPGNSGGSASGCRDRTAYSWSGRGMWNRNNEWIAYMYNPGKRSDCGDGVNPHRNFTANRWHTIKQYYKLNSVGVANGIHTMWFDGERVSHTSNFVYRTNPNVHINLVYWSIFRGGSTQDWAGSSTGSIDIDNVLIVAP